MKVLVPVDGSESAARAAEHAAKMKEENPEIEVTILFVENIMARMWQLYSLVPGKEADIPPSDYHEYIKNEAQPALENAGKAFEDKGLDVEKKIIDTEKDISEEIKDFVEERGFDKVIMGKSGSNNIEAAIAGGVTPDVLSIVDAPVTVIE